MADKTRKKPSDEAPRETPIQNDPEKPSTDKLPHDDKRDDTDNTEDLPRN